MSIKNFTTFAFLIIGFLFCAFEINAQKMTIPSGSYQKSCINISVKGSVLQAICNASGGDKQFKLLNNFEDFYLCADDIRNDNATIKCTKSENGPLMKKAETAFEAMFPYHYGLPVCQK